MNKHMIPVFLVSALVAAPCAFAQTSSAAPDNSKSNKVDASNATATADAQSNQAGDIDLARRIRQALIADKTLSTYAHNVKIVAANGTVTLNGVVRSEDEKSAVEMKAVQIAGKAQVTDALKIAPK